MASIYIIVKVIKNQKSRDIEKKKKMEEEEKRMTMKKYNK